MTTPLELCRRARELGLELEVCGDKLAVTPANRVPAEFADELKAHKAELLAWLTSPPCPGWRAVPPCGLPLNSLPPCPTPANARRVVEYITRQINGTDALCEWCLRRELGYSTAYRWPDALCCYAAARDAAGWQLNRTESEVCALLAGFDRLNASKFNNRV